MALIPLRLNPGINREGTDQSNKGGWFDGNNVRFRNGFPEKIGGWVRSNLTQPLLGACRSIHIWSALDNTELIGMGTNLKYYVLSGGTLIDATPLASQTTLATDPFTYTDGSPVVTINQPGHSAGTNDFVIFSGATSFGGYSAEDINTEFQITVIDGSNYSITLPTPAIGSGTGGGSAVVASLQIPTGTDSNVSGTGWGAGYWGGGVARLVYTFTTAAFTATTGSSLIEITHANHGAVDGDWVTFENVASFGGIPAQFLNNIAFEVTNATTNTYIVECRFVATSTETAGSALGSGTVATYWSTASTTGWGVAAGTPTAGANLRLWSQDNYGEDLLINPRDGGIYYWDRTSNGPAVVLTDIPGASQCPLMASYILVSDNSRQVIAFGTNPLGETYQDKLLVRWSDNENYLEWNITSTTNAGELRIGSGSFIVSVLETKQETLIWTDASLHSLQYVGGGEIYQLNPLGYGIDIIGPNARVAFGDVVYWMGRQGFYTYDGRINPLPCDVRDYVYSNIDRNSNFKVYAAVNKNFNEITWFYTSNGGTDNDRYVTYCVDQRIWYYGQVGRTAWNDRGSSGYPLATAIDGYMYQHESGTDDGSTNPPSPIPCYITSSPIELQEGDQFIFINRIIPDITFRGAPTAGSTNTTFTLVAKDYPGEDWYANYPVTVTYNGTDGNPPRSVTAPVELFTRSIPTRLRGRAAIIKVESEGVGTAWRLGVPRIDSRTDGRR